MFAKIETNRAIYDRAKIIRQTRKYIEVLFTGKKRVKKVDRIYRNSIANIKYYQD